MRCQLRRCWALFFLCGTQYKDVLTNKARIGGNVVGEAYAKAHSGYTTVTVVVHTRYGETQHRAIEPKRELFYPSGECQENWESLSQRYGGCERGRLYFRQSLYSIDQRLVEPRQGVVKGIKGNPF